ncbi:MAG: RHS repeat-associated core domain-containing protein [Pseudomonadota bacterium]
MKVYIATSYRVYDNNFGRVVRSGYPGSFEVTHEYNSHGHLSRVIDANGSGTVYQQVLSKDAFGNVTQEKLGNGVETVKNYDEQQGFLRSIIAGSGGSVSFWEQNYDALGNVLSREQKNLNRAETFVYDDLNRLTDILVAGVNYQSYRYDAIGNVTYKSDQGDYTYGNAAGPHAVTAISRNGSVQHSFSYDANGNLLSDINNGVTRSLTYTAFDKPRSITKGSERIEFAYGADRSRYRRIDTTEQNGQSVIVDTRYLGKSYEKIAYTGGTNNGQTHHKYYIGNVVVTEKILSNGSAGATETHYLHQDHLGSVTAITNQSGQVLQRFRYDPFGKQYQVTGSGLWAHVEVAGRLSFLGAATERGFTGHEMLASVGLIHMNGRVFDASVGRFMQADPHIQAPKNLQSVNRYSYVLNNPLSYTDPSGYFFKALAGAVFSKKFFNAVNKVPLLNQAISIGLNFVPGCQAWCTAVWSAGSTYAMTGSLGAGIQAGLISYATAQMHGAVSGYEVGSFANIFGNALVGGISAELQGGKFGHGFVAAGFTAAMKSQINKIGGGDTATSLQQLEEGRLARVAAAAVVGGTASVMSGGKFANGAVTGAFTQLFNGEQSLKADVQRRQEAERTWSSYLPGTEAGDRAAQYWADIAVNSDHPLASLAHVPGVFAALWTEETAINTAFTLSTAGLGTIPSFGSNLGSKLFLSETFGITSLRFANSVTGTAGTLNVTGNFFKVGWSGVSRNGGGMMLRIGVGSTGNTARYHFYVPGSFVPNSFSNGSIQVKRALHKMGQ